MLLAKVMGVILFFMLARWSWPRFRYDQLMDMGWKVMIPWGLVNWWWWPRGWNTAAIWPGCWACRPSRAWRRSAGGVLLLTWLVTTVFDPTASGNRPRRELRTGDQTSP